MMAEVLRMGALDIHVCVPTDWSDDQVTRFAERECPCGTTWGWQIRRTGNEALVGMPERNPCALREGFVHIILDA